MKKSLKFFTRFFHNRFEKNLSVIFVLTLFFTSCERDLIHNRDGIVVKGSTDAIPSVYFNWETVDYVPTPPGYTQIHVPWFGATGSIVSRYDADVYSDYKASDGWVMLYSNFSYTTYVNNPYFMLYNRYRGLLRIYQFSDNQGLQLSSSVFSGISWAGNGNGNNKVLNFLGKDIIDVNASTTQYYAMEPSPINSSELPVAPNKWHMLQYELAYDPAILPTTSQTPPRLTWYMNYNQVSEISLGGSLVGKLSGSAGSSGLTDGFIQSKLTGTPKAVGEIGFYSLGKSLLDSTNIAKWGLPYNVFTDLRKGFVKALDIATNGVPGKIFNILNAVLGGSSSSPTASTNITAQLTLNGTINSSGALFSGTSVSMPGSLAQDSNGNYYLAVGQLPVNNIKLGVFNLSSRPVVPITYYGSWWNDDPEYPGYITQIIIGQADNSNKLVFNPELLAIADVQILQQDVIINGRDNDWNALAYPQIETDATIEPAGYVNPSYMWLHCNFVIESKAVRFVIKVIPNDTSIPSSIIVKTFRAD
jgi:hypothetical protein